MSVNKVLVVFGGDMVEESPDVGKIGAFRPGEAVLQSADGAGSWSKRIATLSGPESV